MQNLDAGVCSCIRVLYIWRRLVYKQENPRETNKAEAVNVPEMQFQVVNSDCHPRENWSCFMNKGLKKLSKLMMLSLLLSRYPSKALKNKYHNLYVHSKIYLTVCLNKKMFWLGQQNLWLIYKNSFFHASWIRIWRNSASWWCWVFSYRDKPQKLWKTNSTIYMCIPKFISQFVQIRKLFGWDNKIFGCYTKNLCCPNQILVVTIQKKAGLFWVQYSPNFEMQTKKDLIENGLFISVNFFIYLFFSILLIRENLKILL